MLNVGLDLRGCAPGFKEHFGRGTGRYAEELSKQLVGRDWATCKIIPLSINDLSAAPWQRTLLQLAPAGRQTLETQIFLPRRFGRLPVDVIHFLSHGDATARCQKPYLVTVLDLIPLRFPDLYKAAKPSWRYHLARYFELSAITKARGILAISEATKRDVVEILGYPEDSVVVTHLGVGPKFQMDEADISLVCPETEEIRARYALPSNRPLLLYSGGIDARKNVRFLVQTFAEVLKNSSAERPILLLVGRIQQDDQYPGLRAEIERLGIADEVFELGFVSDEELVKLYRAADLYVFPSLYEGFGLPVLEAMASGVPVVAGRNSSIVEIAGDGAVLLPDGDLMQWTKEILRLLASVQDRKDLIIRGLRQAKQFTWEQTARRTLDAYEYFRQRGIE